MIKKVEITKRHNQEIHILPELILWCHNYQQKLACYGLANGLQTEYTLKVDPSFVSIMKWKKTVCLEHI